MNLAQRIREFLHWESSPTPDTKILPEIYPHLKPFRLPLILTVLTMLVGTLGYIIIDGFSIIDAIYQTGITFTTVGFGEIAPISDTGRIFTIILIIAGFAIFSSAVGIMLSELDRGHVFAILKERRMLYKIARLKKHFVVCYHNDYSLEVINQLRKNHIPFVVIDPREEIHQWAKEYKYPAYLQAEPHAELTMLKAHLSSAKGLISMSKSIADNIALIASLRLFEKEHNVPKPYYVISTANTMGDVEKLKKLGADTVVSPTQLTAQRVSAMALRPDMQNLFEEFLYKSDNPLDMQEIAIPKYSWCISKKLKETHLKKITNVSVVGIIFKNGKFLSMPKGDVVITEGAKLLMIGNQKDIKITKGLLRKREKPEELKFV